MSAKWYRDSAAPAPSLVVPPAASGITGNAAVWFAANWDICEKFELTVGGWYRYVLWRCAAQSGNVQLSVVRFTGSGDLPAFERVASSGIIACPAVGDVRTDLHGAAFYLPPGRYGLSLWADNTTFQTLHSNVTPIRTHREAVHLAGGIATGIPRTGIPNALTNRYVSPLALEGDI